MNKPCRRLAVLFGLAGTLSMSAVADPPAPVSAPLPVPAAAPPFSPASPPQKALLTDAARASLQNLAQNTEREATRQARARQFDQAQLLYAKAASLYHQQARLARRAAQEMAKSGQLSLAARAHAEALRADNRFLACLASEVSAIKKSSLGDTASARPLTPAAHKVSVLPQAVLPPVVPRPRSADHPAHRAVLPSLPQKRLSARAGAISASARLHEARARKSLLPALKALHQAAEGPLVDAAGLIASQEHGLRQEQLRLRRAQLQERGSPQPLPASP